MTLTELMAHVATFYASVLEPLMTRYYLDAIIPGLLVFVMGWAVVSRLTGSKDGR